MANMTILMDFLGKFYTNPDVICDFPYDFPIQTHAHYNLYVADGNRYD